LKPVAEAPATKRLKPPYDELFSSVAIIFISFRYTKVVDSSVFRPKSHRSGARSAAGGYTRSILSST
jgi:hypothetical protein